MLRQFAILLLAGCAFQAQAKVDMTQAARLGSDLTPLGAERAGNAAGTIPAWDGGLTSAPAGYLPWFAVPGRRSADHRLVTGHWSALGLKLEPTLLALDTGCLWGRELSALRLEDRQLFQVDCSSLGQRPVVF